MRLVLGCLCSAILGSLFTVWLLSADGGSSVVAQERGSNPAAIPPVDRIKSLAARAFDQDGLTPEEAINIAVYETANRSVVNITAKSVKTERLIMVEQSEGSGSGSIIDLDGHILTNLQWQDLRCDSGGCRSAQRCGRDSHRRAGRRAVPRDPG